jgi:hypothetical protein
MIPIIIETDNETEIEIVQAVQKLPILEIPPRVRHHLPSTDL